ncbi:hypothetical protein NP233_g1825 [Leucocoprinus birnbaumii]|uniref:Transcription termination and cleavage factor C-terminal domain-containing protein n=1 Tax=Leucocoprinus birnbaumii TaxID=56174 RepID=A0AAD5YXP3_9AGAR|nr:hypothetical protein NP233_g1825 [Leucocoprinus birnbaumii]
MADQSSTEQLLELMIQLKKTTPKAARDILSSQPAIALVLAFSLLSTGPDLTQKTLAQYHESNARSQPTPSAPSVPPVATSTPPISALPPHLQTQYRTSTPPTNTPTPPVTAHGYPSQQGYAPPPQGYPQAGGSTPGYLSYGGQPQAQPSYPSYPQQPVPPPTYGAPPPAAAPPRPQAASGVRPEMLAAFPEDQKALIMHVLSMTPEQLNSLPPEQRSTYMQIRATLGVH